MLSHHACTTSAPRAKSRPEPLLHLASPTTAGRFFCGLRTERRSPLPRGWGLFCVSTAPASAASDCPESAPARRRTKSRHRGATGARSTSERRTAGFRYKSVQTACCLFLPCSLFPCRFPLLALTISSTLMGLSSSAGVACCPCGGWACTLQIARSFDMRESTSGAA